MSGLLDKEEHPTFNVPLFTAWPNGDFNVKFVFFSLGTFFFSLGTCFSTNS